MEAKRTSSWWLWALVIASLALGFIADQALYESQLRSRDSALAEQVRQNQVLENKIEDLVAARIEVSTQLVEKRQELKTVEAELDRQRNRHQADCEVPLPEKLWPLYDKCEQAWSECDWSGSTVTTNDRTYNWCEARAQECRFLLSAAQPGVR